MKGKSGSFVALGGLSKLGVGLRLTIVFAALAILCVSAVAQENTTCRKPRARSKEGRLFRLLLR